MNGTTKHQALRRREARIAYTQRRQMISEQIDTLRDALQNHLGGKRPDWGHVGDLAYLSEKLVAITLALGGRK